MSAWLLAEYEKLSELLLKVPVSLKTKLAPESYTVDEIWAWTISDAIAVMLKTLLALILNELLKELKLKAD